MKSMLKVNYEICVHARQPRKPFKLIRNDTKLLELIHNDVCDLKIYLIRIVNFQISARFN